MQVLGTVAVPALLKLFDEGSMAHGYAGVAAVLGTLRAREAVMPIVMRLEKETDRANRNSLISALGGIGDGEALRYLVSLTQDPTRHKEDREQATEMLSRIDSDDARSVLIAIARGPNASTLEKHKAITALGLAPSENDIPILTELASGNIPYDEVRYGPSPWLIEAAIDVMEKIGTEACVPFLVQYLVSVYPTIEVSKVAKRTLLRIGTPEALAALDEKSLQARVNDALRVHAAWTAEFRGA
jgi:HEAT repeat protein